MSKPSDSALKSCINADLMIKGQQPAGTTEDNAGLFSFDVETKNQTHNGDQGVKDSQTANNLRSQQAALELAIARGTFNVNEAALYLSVAPKTVRNMKAGGRIQPLSTNGLGRRLFSKKELDRVLTGVRK